LNNSELRRKIENAGSDGDEIDEISIEIIDQMEGSCEHGNKSSGSIKCWEILEQLHNWRLLKKGLAP
jgi:hypothetical protein